MKKIFTVWFSLIVMGISAQETASPDYALIQKNIKDKSSRYYYTHLCERYARADTSMTLDETRHLYYGYAFTNTMVNKAVMDETQASLKTILQKTNPDAADLQKVVEYTGILLQASPFSITIKEYRVYCLKELGRFAEAKTERAQTDMLIDAILSSGDGTTKQNSIHVVNTGNEYEVATLMGFEPREATLGVHDMYDYIAVKKNNYNISGLYFEVAAGKKELTGL